MADPFVTADQLGLHLQRTVDAPTALQAVTMASDLIRMWCGWTISQEDATFVLDGRHEGHLLSLPTLRLNAVDAVRVDGVVVAVEGYSWSHTGHMLREDATWPTTMRSIEVDVDHGYVVIPGGVAAVALSLAGRMYDNPQNYRLLGVGTAQKAWGPDSSRDIAGNRFSGMELTILGPYQLPSPS